MGIDESNLINEESIVSGFYDLEEEKFRWIEQEATLNIPDKLKNKKVSIELFSPLPDLLQNVKIFIYDKLIKKTSLLNQWNAYSFKIPYGGILKIKANKIFPKEHYPKDNRTLSIKVGNLKIIEKIDKRMDNKIKNYKEFLLGKTILKSYPPSLGIDIEGRCNLKPSCTYCAFEEAKKVEGKYAYIPFSKKTFLEYGKFFKNAYKLINCAIGEPFLSRNISEIIELFDETDKILEMSTNGILLTKRNRSLILGKNISLYISLDAATKDTFAKFRNNQFDLIVNNVKKLCEAKIDYNGLPKVFLVFMPMKVNLHELGDFVKLCKKIKADRVILRPLNMREDSEKEPNIIRNGYNFIYKEEVLSYDELLRVSLKARDYAKKYNVGLYNQLGFGTNSFDKLLSSSYKSDKLKWGIGKINISKVTGEKS